MVASVRIHDARTALVRNATDGGLVHYLSEVADYLRASGKLPETWNVQRVVDTTAFRLAATGQ
ncbi:MAG: hypothetical protein H0W78_10880 [Planctomycetes bacterium]|jgi:hypothetical protein|nr:hypothetical protein [Planctomycetota bacterium]